MTPFNNSHSGRLISRDPFAREELHRFVCLVNESSTCLWCGQVKHTPNGTPYLYQYTVETDSGRSNTIAGLFDSVGCMRAYRG